MRVAHFAFDFSFRDQGGNGVDDDDIDSTAADQFFCDFKGLFAVIRLGNEQFVGVDAKVAGIDRIEGVFGIDEAAMPPFFWADAMACRARVVFPDDSGRRFR